MEGEQIKSYRDKLAKKPNIIEKNALAKLASHV
jgi:hypothetical protein